MHRAENIEPEKSAARIDHALDRILSRAEVVALTGLSGTTLWREAHAGRFPKPYRLTPGRVGYRKSEIEAWLAARFTGRNLHPASN